MLSRIIVLSVVFPFLASAHPSVLGAVKERDVVASTTRTVTSSQTTTITKYVTLTTCPASTTSSTRQTTSTTTTSSSTTPTGDDVVKKQGCFWVVPGAGKFRNMATYTFTGNSLPGGLMASDYEVDDRSGNPSIPFNHAFTPANVRFSGGFLNLVVPGGQKPTSRKALGCAEVQTIETSITAASVRMKAIFSSEPGTCHGHFFYQADNQEIDIEFLTDSASEANNGDDEPIPIWYSNQAVVQGEEASQNPVVPPSDPRQSVHEHRIDWTPDLTAFYYDGAQQAKFTDNIPTEPGPWVFNNWANGDPAWSVGPPKKDNSLKIQSIVIYYNTSSTVDQC